MIDADELLEDITQCLSLAPHGVSQAIINRQIDLLRRTKPDAAHLADTQALATLVRSPLRFIEEDVLSALFECEIYVVPLAIPVAYSKPRRNGSLIVLGRGLLNLIAACGYLTFYSDELHRNLGENYPLETFPSTSSRDAIPVFLFALIYRHYCFGEPLPDFASIAPRSAHETVRNSLAGAATFILLHELGHLQLRHSESETLRPMDAPLVIEEACRVINARSWRRTSMQ